MTIKPVKLELEKYPSPLPLLRALAPAPTLIPDTDNIRIKYSWPRIPILTWSRHPPTRPAQRARALTRTARIFFARLLHCDSGLPTRRCPDSGGMEHRHVPTSQACTTCPTTRLGLADSPAVQTGLTARALTRISPIYSTNAAASNPLLGNCGRAGPYRQTPNRSAGV
jgi:hypothetical protein